MSGSSAAPAAVPDHSARSTTRSTLVTLWTALLLAVLFRDVHEFFRPGLIDQIRAGVVNGTAIGDGVLVAGGIGVLLGIGMLPVTRSAPRAAARLASLVVGPLTLAGVIAGGVHDADDILFLAAEAMIVVVIVTVAWRWGEGGT
ncbi:hypothetical protein [Euzebya tangerina]|uniref:hypothetical protein n=1 Tax=Euzebya tangerina TaxID=591198 RepID=UPI000E32198E|nr:hypothetical protein [Euzebya tangerina]